MLRAAAEVGRDAYLEAFLTVNAERPHLGPFAPYVLYTTLGPTLGAGSEATAAIWGLAQTTALTYPESLRRAGFSDGDALFDARAHVAGGGGQAVGRAAAARVQAPRGS